MLRVLRFSLAIGCVLLAGRARAETPARWAVAVERLFGVTHSRSDLGTNTSFSLLSKVGGAAAYSMPRLGFDYVSAPGFTVGAAGGFQVGAEDNQPDGDALLATIRAGYFLAASPGFELWPRAGFTLLYSNEDSLDATTYALTLELPLLFRLSDALALTLTPHADLHLGETADLEEVGPFSTSASTTKLSQYGVQFGMAAFF